MDSKDFVLAKFDEKQQKQLPNLIKETTAILTEYVYSGELPHETRSFIV
jgi:peptidyl-tRNA hydrolase